MVESHGDLLGVAVVGLAKSRQVRSQERQGEAIGKMLDRGRTPEHVVLIEGVVDTENVLVLGNIFDGLNTNVLAPKLGSGTNFSKPWETLLKSAVGMTPLGNSVQ